MEDNREGTTAPAMVATDVDQRSESQQLRDFASIREKRAYERRYLPFLKTVVDFDVVCEIGYHQLTGVPLTVKHLLLLRVAAPATVMRRLDRLCALGVVTRVRCRRDGRVHELRLATDVLRLFAEYAHPMFRGKSE